MDLVVALVRSSAFADTPQSRRLLLDLALGAHVRAALRAHADTSHVDISVDVDNGGVTLSGIVANPQERDRAVDVASSVAGVTKVENRLGTMTGSPGSRIFPAGLAR